MKRLKESSSPNKLISVPQFAEREPYLGSAANVYAKIREGFLDGCVVRIGARIFIDTARWADLQQAGGRPLLKQDQQAA